MTYQCKQQQIGHLIGMSITQNEDLTRISTSISIPTVKELAKSLADYEKKLEVYVCTDKILEDQLHDARVTVGKAKKKKLDIIQKDEENIEKGLKFLAYDEGRMESIQKEWMVESEV
nr:hypothetical protein [Tanacetum cinerariifolium]